MSDFIYIYIYIYIQLGQEEIFKCVSNKKNYEITMLFVISLKR